MDETSHAVQPDSNINVNVNNSTFNNRHRCFLCDRVYERADHLSRHLKSHDNERSHRCSQCGKGFNRADLLNRHCAAHARDAKNGGDVQRRRTGRACDACIKAKTKCDDGRPCERCVSRDIACVESKGGNPRHRLSQSNAISPLQRQQQTQEQHREQQQQQLQEQQHEQDQQASQLQHLLPSPGRLVNGLDLDMTTNLNMNDATLIMPQSDMMPEMTAQDDSLALTQTEVMHNDDLLPNNFSSDLFFDSIHDLNFGFWPGGLDQDRFEPAFSETGGSSATVQSDRQLRSEAFKKSPWSWNDWNPERNSSAFAGHEINVQEKSINAADQLISPGKFRPAQCNFEQEARDRLIRVVTQTTDFKLEMPSFPSRQLLEELVDAFLLQDSNSLGSYFHAASFSCLHARAHLLLAMVAGGAQYVALPAVSKMGLVFQDVLRLANADLFESDNALTRDLDATRASHMWVDLGVWSGFRRKTEIAISFFGVTFTMLNWSGAFTKSRYKDFTPHEDDMDEQLVEKWKSWAHQESLKRFALQLFLHDSKVMLVHMQNPLASPSQMFLPLPASPELWLAPSASAWRDAHLRLQPPSQADLPSLLEIFGNNTLLNTVGPSIDKSLCLLIACHALGHQVVAYRQRTRLLTASSNNGRRDRWLTHSNSQRDLYEDLTTMSAYCELQGDNDSTPELMFTLSFLNMSLHVSLEDIQTFSGVSGEDEARKSYPRVRAWASDVQSSIAVWHAGQVFRTAQTFEGTKLRDFYAVALYHAALTLWVYGMVKSDAATSRVQSPAPPPLTNPSNSTLFIDSQDDKASRAFTLLGLGSPGIHGPMSEFISLNNSRAIMSRAADILRNNFPQGRNSLPPLVENLSKLMIDIGNLSGKG